MNKLLSISSQFALTLSLIVSTANAMESDGLDLSYNGPPCAMKPFTNEDLARYPHLTSLNLAGNTVITDEGLTSLTGLTMLNLRGNRQISDAAVRTLTNLVTLHLGDNDKISDTGLAPLSHLVNISRVNSMSPQDRQEMELMAKRDEYKRTGREFNESFQGSLKAHEVQKAALIAETPGWWEDMTEDEAVNSSIKFFKLTSEGKNIEEELPVELQEFSVKFFKAVFVGKVNPPDNILNRLTKYAEEHDPKLLEALEKQRQESERGMDESAAECTIF